MKIVGEPKAFLSNEALQLLNLYESLGQRAEIFLPRHIFDNLTSFVSLCMEEPDDPAKQQAEINRYLLKFREDIPGYTHVSLMLIPHNNSKAFELSSKRGEFAKKISALLDTDGTTTEIKTLLRNIRDSHDLSVGTPPINSRHIDFMSQVQLGGHVRDLRKYRDVIGVTGDINEAHWNYLMDTLEQMISQSTHYTTKAEISDFLHRSQWAVNFKGMNGMIRTVVSGNADKAVQLLKGDVFHKDAVVVLESPAPETLYEQMTADTTSIFVVKVKHARINHYSGPKWFPLLTRLVIVDDSKESRSSNTSLVFCFHNGIINTLNKVHTKKLGSPANTQLNLRLILENVNPSYLKEFREKLEMQIEEYGREIKSLLLEQTGSDTDIEKRITLFKLDSFSRQVVQDKYSLEKLRDFIFFLENCHKQENKKIQTQELIDEFESRMKNYFYAGNKLIDVITILEGGGRHQIKTFGDYLRSRTFNNLSSKIRYACRLILDIIPSCYERTLKNHFHKNFGINLFLEKYQEYITKTSRDADNKGRFEKFLIDLGIRDKYFSLSDDDKEIVKNFLSALGNLDQTSVSDSVQMIIRDLLFNPNGRPKPYIVYNAVQAWEYKDLLPDDCFDINPFDIEIENDADGRLAYDRLVDKLLRIKSTLALFDDSGSLWDLFCENTTIIVNDPNNPTGYSDFNSESVNNFLRFLNSCKITLFLDEAYAESVKIEDRTMPKWRTLSRYIMNNINAQSRIKAVSSLSTTKNLAATGERLGAVALTPQASDFAKYARSCNSAAHGNNNSLLMLNNTLQTAQVAKSIKDQIEAELPKNASRSKIKKAIVRFIVNQIDKTEQSNEISKTNRQLHKTAGFEGSPLYLFLLDELIALDKLDVLGLPDDFKYQGEPFFVYYQAKLVENLNRFRINKNFRSESLKRMKMAKSVAARLLEEAPEGTELGYIQSDGSYLFNFRILSPFSYADVLLFCRALAKYRGVATVPYPTGLVRFSLGGYIAAGKEGMKIFSAEIEDAFSIFIRYWTRFAAERADEANKGIESKDLLERVFYSPKDQDFIDSLIRDYKLSARYKKDKAPSLQIRDVRSLYHTSPERSGVTITTIGRSANSVIELHGDIVGSCKDVFEFVRSSAFTKIYENLLAQVYKKVPALSDMDFNTVSSRYSKAVILKYITNKKTFQPNHHVLDNPEEKNVMREILIEMENLLFSDSKMKILAINATGDPALDKAKLEGLNAIIKKYIREILLHFNLPFEKESLEPSRKEIIRTAGECFEEITGIKLSELNLNIWVDEFMRNLRDLPEFKGLLISQKSIGYIMDTVAEGIARSPEITDKILYLYLLNNDNSFYKLVCKKLQYFNEKIKSCDDAELRMFTEEFVSEILPMQLEELSNYIMRKKDIKIAESEIYAVTRRVVRFYISMIKRTRGTDYYNRYAHTMVRIVETAFKKQNSSVNEMVQHGISLYKGFAMENKALETFEGGRISWINELMSKCGVISSEQPVQQHTRIVTDAKKREYPFHKIDRTESRRAEALPSDDHPTEYIRYIDTRPDSSFFTNRLSRFVRNMDSDDYRCKVVKHGIVKELVIFQKGYLKYLTDNYRLNYTEDISLKDIVNFVPDVISLLGAPEKLISFPQIGYFDIKGPSGNIKTIVTPLKKEADYFGDVKKPRLTVINEKVKEIGGIPRHGSLFLVEENDGSVFVIEINGDSGVGKSEMIAAFVLKWLRNNLEGIRSVKMIAGDMFHEFQDADGNLYGIGTEVGDFSRTTDFDPDYIKYYKFLFESSADSNVDDRNARSTVSGMCDITMPYRVDIMLSASNYSKDEGGITRMDNPENFLLYIDAHGERKEKATSGDGPNFQRTLKRYTADKNIVEVISRHGNYLDDILDWDYNPIDRQYYLASSYKLLDKIDITEVVRMIFVGHSFTRDGIRYTIEDVAFDMIQNRFTASTVYEDEAEKVYTDIVLDRRIFSSIFDALASTPGGQPFIAEEDQVETVHRLIECLRGGKDGRGGARHIQCGVLSTEIGKKGREITGPQKAAAALKQLIQEVRVNKPEINEGKIKVKRLINEKYYHIFGGEMNSSELWRYNFYLYQLENMRKADLRRMDNRNKRVDISNLVDFHPVAPDHEFSPLLVNPNLNIELSSFSETFEELMSFPNYPEFAEEFAAKLDRLYIADGYSEETNINNMIVQLLILEGYISSDDLAQGSVIEKVNRETIAAAKHAVVQYLNRQRSERAAEQPRTAAKKTPEKSKQERNK
ncbi:aminotransferase class I/II-fold pyridoxal phosphate-dependent enzyme [Alistipes ihumii]|uniref:aminotransferase class I/II-fold pyridoxal phosphate-dependent enzyme n=1 Tax=Alistipes ihumii TaxID=1470347 RepID=UPI0027B8C1E2|nr:aminotransferase class I/II-fold pyridoxal phosphate-dependent enzyme [Alistipes ihumii]